MIDKTKKNISKIFFAEIRNNNMFLQFPDQMNSSTSPRTLNSSQQKWEKPPQIGSFCNRKFPVKFFSRQHRLGSTNTPKHSKHLAAPCSIPVKIVFTCNCNCGWTISIMVSAVRSTTMADVWCGLPWSIGQVIGKHWHFSCCHLCARPVIGSLYRAVLVRGDATSQRRTCHLMHILSLDALTHNLLLPCTSPPCPFKNHLGFLLFCPHLSGGKHFPHMKKSACLYSKICPLAEIRGIRGAPTILAICEI